MFAGAGCAGALCAAGFAGAGACAGGVACFAGSGSAGACAAGVACFAGAGSAGAWAACFAGAAGGAASAGVADDAVTNTSSQTTNHFGLKVPGAQCIVHFFVCFLNFADLCCAIGKCY